MTRREQIKFLIIRSIGNFLLLFGLYIVFITFAPVLSQELRFRIDTAKKVRYRIKTLKEIPVKTQTINQPSGDIVKAIFDDAQDRILIPYDTYFSILIPKIGASSKVIPNVDPTDESAFRKELKNGIAHAKGTVFPGMVGNIYLFAHSTDSWWNTDQYNAVFYLLKELQKGDEIIIFYQNVRYNYTVTDRFIANADNVSFLTDHQREEQKLILQTCWPPGTTWKRLFVIARPSLSAK